MKTGVQSETPYVVSYNGLGSPGWFLEKMHLHSAANMVMSEQTEIEEYAKAESSPTKIRAPLG
jgi:hypothetical protein